MFNSEPLLCETSVHSASLRCPFFFQLHMRDSVESAKLR
jgi:hypothetical protein